MRKLLLSLAVLTAASGVFAQGSFPVEGHWYHMRTSNTDAVRANTYLSYYPTAGTAEWYIFNASNGSKANLTTNDYIAAGDLATSENTNDENVLNGQIWTFIAGTGDNAGRYCIVNKAYPDGAISNVVMGKDGVVNSSNNNNSRWIYEPSRKDHPENVCWFDLSVRMTFDNHEGVNLKHDVVSGNPYLGFAVGGNQYQLMRNNGGDDETNFWIPEIILDETESLDAYFEEQTAELKAVAESFASMKAIIGGDACPNLTLPEGTTSETLAAAVDAANAQYQAYINKFNRKQFTMQCAIRRDHGYLAGVLSGTNVAFNVIPEITPDAVWQIILDGNKLKLYNRTTGYYIGTDQGARLLANAQLFRPAVETHNDVDYVRFYKGDSSTYISVDNNSEHTLGSWFEAYDEGSPWILAAADCDFVEPQLSTETEKHYYRVISARWMYQLASPSLAVNGENQDGDGNGEATSRGTANIPGIYWYIEDAGDNAIKLVNLTGYKLTGVDNGVATMSTEGSNLYIVKQTADQFEGKTCYAISTKSNASWNCLDVQRQSGAGSFVYNTTADGVGNGDNGSLWYFIPATESEIANATEAYITAVKNRLNAVADDSENLAALSSNEAVKTYSAILQGVSEYTTVSQVNEAKRNLLPEVYKIFDNYIVGQHVQLSATRSSWTTCFMSDNGTCIKGIGDDADFSTIWVISKGENGYILTNESTGNVVTFGEDADSKVFPTSDNAEEAYEFLMTYNVTNAKFAIYKQGTTLDQRRAIHLANPYNTDTSIVKWSAAGVENSHWYISALADPDVVIEQNEQGNGHIVRYNGEFTANVTPETVLVEIYKLEEPEAQQGAAAPGMRKAAPANSTLHCAITAGEFEDKTFVLDNELTNGNYALVVPGAMLTKDGKHTRALYSTYGISEDGAVTGIREIESAKGAYVADVYYDLQGRRVANPRHGLYIHNGRKVFIK